MRGGCIRRLASAIPVQRSNQLSYQANWELVIKLVRNMPGKDEDEIMNTNFFGLFWNENKQNGNDQNHWNKKQEAKT